MKVLVINCGSSSLKYQLLIMPSGKVVASGYAEKVGSNDSFVTHKWNGKKKKVEIPMINHEEAIQVMVDLLTCGETKVINNISEIDAIGHRVVHGGEKFASSVLIDSDVVRKIIECNDLAPLHNPANLIGIQSAKDIFGDVPMVAVFDTAFHQTMPQSSYMYALPYELYEKYGVRRYGFHGTSHKYVYERLCEMTGKKDLKVISCHIGSGASICAIDKGKVVDTTMGLTPLEGLMMGTRSGDIDPAIISFVMKKENMTIEEMDTLLNKKSGLLGIYGKSNDSRDVLENMKKDPRAKLANDMFEYKIVKYIGAYNAALGGCDAIIFTAGCGENSVENRRNILNKLEFMGIYLDEEKNNSRGKEVKISDDDSKIDVYVIPTNEELMIAKDTYKLVKKAKKVSK
ncbi:MAG: acetate kinase [Clostridia bacterium]|nr:acetate kinase [Clostridia bacterium]